MQSKDDKINSIHAVKQLTQNSESFLTTTTVVVQFTNKSKLTYDGIKVFCGYDHGYGQYKVEIYWEDDSTQPHYKEEGLYGQYNTNFQHMEYNDNSLIIYDQALSISIFNE